MTFTPLTRYQNFHIKHSVGDDIWEAAIRQDGYVHSIHGRFKSLNAFAMTHYRNLGSSRPSANGWNEVFMFTGVRWERAEVVRQRF